MKVILGLVGEIASGKGAASDYLIKNYNAKLYKLSAMLRDILDRLHLEHSRENLAKLSLILREGFGHDIFFQVVSKEISQEKEAELIVIDGIRRLSDMYSKILPNFKLVYIDASPEVRFERINKRGENIDDKQKTWEQFKKDNELESEVQIRGLKDHADFVIDNNGGIEELHGQMDKIIKNLK